MVTVESSFRKWIPAWRDEAATGITHPGGLRQEEAPSMPCRSEPATVAQPPRSRARNIGAIEAPTRCESTLSQVECEQLKSNASGTVHVRIAGCAFVLKLLQCNVCLLDSRVRGNDVIDVVPSFPRMRESSEHTASWQLPYMHLKPISRGMFRMRRSLASIWKHGVKVAGDCGDRWPIPHRCSLRASDAEWHEMGR